MKKLMIMTVLSILGISNSSHAEGPGWLSTTKIKRIVVVATGGVNVRLENELQSCTSQSGYGVRYASLYPDHPGIDRIYSLLLSAYVSQTDIQIYLSDSTCRIGEVVIGGNFSS